MTVLISRRPAPRVPPSPSPGPTPPAPGLDGQLQSRANSFDLMRLAAASLVVISHCYHLHGYKADPWARVTGFKSLGGVGVAAFFVMSGFLVARSFEIDPHCGRFALRRALRIFPGLVVCSLFTVLVIGPLCTTLPLGQYLTSAQAWTYLARTPLLVSPPMHLPGVFEHSLFLPVVNGSLWTLQYEVAMYAGLVLLGCCGLMRTTWVWLGAALAALAADWHLHDAPLVMRLGSTVPQSFYLAFLFLSGVLAWVAREKIRFCWQGAAVAGIVLLLAVGTPFFPLVFMLSAPYITLALGLARLPLAERITRHGDFSYGIYIYSFPIQQAVAACLPPDRLPFVAYVLLCLALSLAVAAGSWFLVERPALSFKPRRRNQHP